MAPTSQPSGAAPDSTALPRSYLVRDLDGGSYLEGFLVAAVAAILTLAPVDPLALMPGGRYSFAEAGHTLASIGASATVVIGLVRLGRSRPDACWWLTRAVRVSLSVAQVYPFV